MAAEDASVSLVVGAANRIDLRVGRTEHVGEGAGA